MSKTVTILPETDDKTLCVHVSGIVQKQDYIEGFEKPLRAIIARHGAYNLYAFYDDDYKGWETDAADHSFKLYSELSDKKRRAAYVNAPDSRHLILKMMEPLMPEGEARFFDKDQQEEAMAWVKGTP